MPERHGPKPADAQIALVLDAPARLAVEGLLALLASELIKHHAGPAVITRANLTFWLMRVSPNGRPARRSSPVRVQALEDAPAGRVREGEEHAIGVVFRACKSSAPGGSA